MIVGNDCQHSYEIKLLVPRNTLAVGIEALADVRAAKQFILTLEEISNGSEQLDPQAMNWNYSRSLQRAFAYVPAMKSGRVTKIPAALVSETRFDAVRIGVRGWHTDIAPEQIPSVIGKLWYSQLELPSVTASTGPVHSVVRTSPLGSFH